ncbi:UDP-N-acetylmuramate dehydrogenase [Phototrophicus methaneseepsis]|uniref:UDP-N-acetylenolpyruvoylglucosamine reductase n=1 Tax=Phototrophicus methaneseepsis TaxID=2710758 RepID=A0A7S8E7X0_9CHLR|nr:UDP-N-acetylmuramate dehydrogenase [Phototrophicus methaneseepsis]QPC81923.1 UDP-N-acetylmuramate dehydrogenase [Phototrophicus methaneseepsis]
MGAFDALTPRLERNVPLAKYTAARLGGPAELFLLVREPDHAPFLEQVIQAAWDDDIPVRVLGKGSNVLISDQGVQGLVIVNQLASVQQERQGDTYKVVASAGMGLVKLTRYCQQHGIAGIEWAVGVPGTVGGAIVNNAGAHGSDMAASRPVVTVLEYGRGRVIYTPEQMQFAYRSTVLKHCQDRRFLVLDAALTLPAGEQAAIREKMTHFNAYRTRTQPPGASLGSIFKNPPGDYAGRLIEACGLKGAGIGGVQVSPVHANFMVNSAIGTASDYYALIQHVQNTVLSQQGVQLELEIELLGEW